jgi:hypothetical protein
MSEHYHKEREMYVVCGFCIHMKFCLVVTVGVEISKFVILHTYGIESWSVSSLALDLKFKVTPTLLKRY